MVPWRLLPPTGANPPLSSSHLTILWPPFPRHRACTLYHSFHGPFSPWCRLNDSFLCLVCLVRPCWTSCRLWMVATSGPTRTSSPPPHSDGPCVRYTTRVTISLTQDNNVLSQAIATRSANHLLQPTPTHPPLLPLPSSSGCCPRMLLGGFLSCLASSCLVRPFAMGALLTGAELSVHKEGKVNPLPSHITQPPPLLHSPPSPSLQ